MDNKECLEKQFESLKDNYNDLIIMAEQRIRSALEDYKQWTFNSKYDSYVSVETYEYNYENFSILEKEQSGSYQILFCVNKIPFKRYSYNLNDTDSKIEIENIEIIIAFNVMKNYTIEVEKLSKLCLNKRDEIYELSKALGLMHEDIINVNSNSLEINREILSEDDNGLPQKENRKGRFWSIFKNS